MMTCILKRVVAMLIVCVMAATAAFADGWIPKQNEKGKWGYVNDAGKWVIRPKFLGATKMYYYRILRRTEPGYPDEGYCAMAKDKNGWGVIVSATGNFINTQRFENVGETAWGNAAVKSNGKWGVIDILTRKEVFECIHDSVLTMISPEIIKVINNGKPDIYRLNNVPLKQNLGDYDGYFLMGRRYLFDADLNLLHVFDSNSDIEVVGKTFIDDKGHFLYDSNFNKINEKEFRSWSYTRESPLISIQDGYDSYRLYDCRNQRYVTETSYREIVLVHEDG